MNKNKSKPHGLLPLALLACSCLTVFSQTTNSFFEFVQEQSKRQYTQVPREVLAVYYVWYGQPEGAWKKVDTSKREIGNTVRYPTKGPYSSHDPEVIDWHIDQAKAHGITGFVVSWWGTGPTEAWVEQAFPILMQRAEKKNFKIAIYWEQAPGGGQHQIERAIAELSYALKRYGRSEAFLKVGGKPVVFAYERVLSQVPMTGWSQIIQGVRRTVGDFVVIADGYHSQSHNTYLFDGLQYLKYEWIPGYLKANPASGKINEFREWAASQYKETVQIARQRSRISCAMIIPGFDNTKSSVTKLKSDRCEGQTYRVLWETAIEANPDWIVLSTWNEWPEGTELEPSVEFGDKYLKITAEYARRFLDEPAVSVTPSAPLPELAPGTTRPAHNLLAGRDAGVLTVGRLYDPEFWLLYCGANVSRLTWSDLVNATNFTARAFPLVVQGGFENFNGAVKSPGDVKRALVRYLSQGGFFVTLPVAPWPLYYDDSQGGKPGAITDDLRLGVNSWDMAALGYGFTFHVSAGGLRGLPATAPFPTAGDLRWTGASRTRVPSFDKYVPLVQLRNSEGRYTGDGAVYVEHKTLPVSPGKTIYVWMRTAEALGEDKFYPALFEFISTKLKPLPAGK